MSCKGNSSYIKNQSPEYNTHSPISRFVTACATTQSQIFFVRIISHVTIENHTAAASNSCGCINIGTPVPTSKASGVAVANGTVHQSTWMKYRIKKPRKKNSSMIGTTITRPKNRIAKNDHAHAGSSLS